MLRSHFLAGASSLALLGGRDPYADIERKYRAELGVAAIDVLDGRALGHRADERFPLASTFKLPLAAAVLARADAGHPLPQRLHVAPNDVLDDSPVVKRALEDAPRGTELSIEQLCAAAIEESDNTAAALLLHALGGPPALNAYLRATGDRATHIAHGEPKINDATFGSATDTTTPRAMAELLERLVLGRLLTSGSTARLLGWMRACKTGGDRLRAGAPHTWNVGDKTGTAAHATNDVGILFVPTGPPIVVAAYVYGGPSGTADRDRALAEVARATVSVFHRNAKRA